MIAPQRIQNEPAWLLHHRPFRDSSQILDILSLDQGRLAVVAKGSRGAKSKLRGILRPFLPLQLSWFIRSDLGTLTGAEMNGAPLSLSGRCAVVRLLRERVDSQVAAPARSAARKYLPPTAEPSSASREVKRSLRICASSKSSYCAYLAMPSISIMIRKQQSHSGLSNNTSIVLNKGWFLSATVKGPMVFRGAEIDAIRNQQFADPAVLKNAGSLLRNVIAYHLDGKELKSRKVLKDMRNRKTGSKEN